MEVLKLTIAANKVFQVPDMPLFWEFIGLLDATCPPIWEKRKKGVTVRAARLLWYSECVGRKITKSEQLWGQELYLLSEWFYQNADLYQEWCIEHQAQIREMVNAEKEN